jgi:hypothetical protein
MQLDKIIGWLLVPKNAVITASAGFVSICFLILLVHYPPVDSSWVRVRKHTFRKAVTANEINSMNCMSGPWNVCDEQSRIKRRR